ncbi:MAG TPA: IS1182 family transposase [Planctomycetota bacterium]|nr:IS1182 family transposase [Planctomycetota bacterium]
MDRDQPYLLPPSLREWLPAGDLAYFVIEVVDTLDLSEIYAYYTLKPDGTAKAASGQPPFHPKMMVALLLYAYANGTASSRRIAWKCERDAGYRVVSANQQPDFRTVSEFRRIHLKALKRLFVQVLHLAREAGLVKLGHVALDGTKVKANASKHKAMSYERMVEKEAEYARQVEELLRRAEETDAAEDAEHGRDRRGDELPEELRFRQKRLERIRAAKKALEDAARAKAQAEGKLDEQGEPKPPARGRAPAVPPGTPKPKDQYNFTDPESHIMKMGDGSFDQAYNCQAAVDRENQIIVAEDATAAPNDKEQVRPMVEETRRNLDAVPKKLSGDSGFYSEGNVTYLREAGIDDYLCPDRLKHGEERPAARGRIPKGMAFIDRVRRKLWTKRGRATYALRKQIVEPVFGQIKQGRGLRQFLLRGLEKVRGEWSLWCTTHNLLKMWAAQA